MKIPKTRNLILINATQNPIISRLFELLTKQQPLTGFRMTYELVNGLDTETTLKN